MPKFSIRSIFGFPIVISFLLWYHQRDIIITFLITPAILGAYSSFALAALYDSFAERLTIVPAGDWTAYFFAFVSIFVVFPFANILFSSLIKPGETLFGVIIIASCVGGYVGALMQDGTA